MESLQGKVVLVSGASRGIGLAIAMALGQQGAKLILTARHRPHLEHVAARLPGTEMAMAADVTSPTDVKRLFTAVRKRVGRLDVLINNAGVFTYRPFRQTTLTEWRRNVETNLTSLYLMTQAALPLLARSHGDIVNILSISSRVPFANCSAYTASKCGARGLTDVLRLELRPHGIRVIAVLPGMTDTKMKDEFNFRVDRPSLLQPPDVAAAVVGTLLQSRRATVEEVFVTPTHGAVRAED